jgi:nitrilase
MVAAIQQPPVYLDRDATVEKACNLIAESAAAGARLVVFPEGFVPGYPLWVWRLPAGRVQEQRALYAELLEQAVAVPSNATQALCRTAKTHGVTVAIGINEVNREASGSSLFNSLLWIGADGSVLECHRKLVPTAGERLVHAQGDGSTLSVHDLPFGRTIGLICWESYMPLVRYAAYAWGAQIYVAPTYDSGEPWLSTMRHIAKEGRVYVIGCCMALRETDVPTRIPYDAGHKGGDGWITPGDSVIVNPDGRIVAGPMHREQGILYGEIDPQQFTGPRWHLDVAGHYARPDIFRLTVNREPRPILAEEMSS